MQNLFRYVGVGVCALLLVAVGSVALAQSNSSIDDVGGSIFDSVSIDLKVNGQDGPVTIKAGSRIVVSWISEDASRCRGNWSRSDIKSSGTVAGRLSRSVIIKAACIDKEGNRDDDSVVVNVEGKAQIAPPPTTLPNTSTSETVAYRESLEARFKQSGSVLLEQFSKSLADLRTTLKQDAQILGPYDQDTNLYVTEVRDMLNALLVNLRQQLPTVSTKAQIDVLDREFDELFDRVITKVNESREWMKQKYAQYVAPTTSAPTTTTSGNVGTGNVGAGTTTTTTPAPSLSATAPTIAGTRTPAGDKLYPGSMSITAIISNSGGALTSPVSARFQYSTNDVNWYDFVEVGPISTTPRNVTHSWEGGVGVFYVRLCIGTGTNNCSSSTPFEVVPSAGAFIGLSRELAAVAVPDTDVWEFVKRWLGR